MEKLIVLKKRSSRGNGFKIRFWFYQGKEIQYNLVNIGQVKLF